MSTLVRSFCKINLGLAVGPVRPDGFHALTTCYQTLALHDVVTVNARPAETVAITLVADHPDVPCTSRGDAEKNTAHRMVQGALQRLGIRAEVHLEIRKQLPVQGGLGAGSANAAAALLGLERELDKALGAAERLRLAAEVGSDVPLFLIGGTVLGLGRGEEVYPLPEDTDAEAQPTPVVVAIPAVGVSTAQAFRDLDEQMMAATGPHVPGVLTGASAPGKLEELSRALTSPWVPTGVQRATTGIAVEAHSDLAGNPLLALVCTGVENDFESVAFRQHPSLREIKHALEGPRGPRGAVYAALSGSGSALFGVYTDVQAAREAKHRVQALGTTALLTETLGRSGYWQRMFG